MIQSKPNFITFWRDLFISPEVFFQKNFRNGELPPAYFTFAVIVFGIGYGIDRLDRQLTKYDLKGKLDEVEFINNWVGYWLSAVIGGIIGGYVLYLIGGWFFNVRLKWSKGTSNLDQSRYIYLYSGVISSAIVILTTCISMLIETKPYDTESEFSLWDLTSLVLLLFFLYYSVYVSYCGVRTLTDAEKMRSKIWFLILPVGVYTIAYIAVVALIINFLV